MLVKLGNIVLCTLVLPPVIVKAGRPDLPHLQAPALSEEETAQMKVNLV